MRITNTYLDADKDAWWIIDMHVFFLTDELYQLVNMLKVNSMDELSLNLLKQK